MKTKHTKTEERNEVARAHSITFYIDDPEIKDIVEAAAKRDNRKKSDWFRQYILPSMLEFAKEQLAKPAVPPVKVAITATAPRHVTMFEKLRREAETSFQPVAR